jgi:hypothetical protein
VTTKATTKAGAAEKAEQPTPPAPEPTPPPAPEPTPVAPPRATKAMLEGGDEGWELVVLPLLGVECEVRYLDGAEMGQLQFLPELAGFQELALKLYAARQEAKDRGEEPEAPTLPEDPIERTRSVAENIRYMQHVAHLAVRDPDLPDEPGDCPDCRLYHRPALWTRKQIARAFMGDDLQTVQEVALRFAALRVVRPLSQGPPESGTPSPAGTGG